MLKKISVICIWLLYLNNATAQQNVYAEKLMGSIKKMAAAINSDSTISSSCKKNVVAFSKVMPPQSKTGLTENAAKQLVKSSQSFTNSITDNYLQKCDSKLLSALLDSAKQLITILDKLTADTSDVHIQFANSNIEGHTKWQVKIGLATTVINHLELKDSMDKIQAQLYLGTTNPVKVSSNQIEFNDSIFKVSPSQGSIVTFYISNNKAVLPGTGLTSNKNATPQNASNFSGYVLPVLLAILFLLLAVAIVFYTSFHKKLGLIINGVNNFSYPPAPAPMQEILSNPAPVTTATTPVILPGAEAEVVLPIISSQTDNLLTCEIMMTAGPRKKPLSEPDSDRDLGEDVCGCITSFQEIFMWLLDGTSDDDSWKDPETKREYFSSRLLAQSVGNVLRKNCIINNTSTLEALMAQAISEVKVKWLQVIGQLPAQEKLHLTNRIENKIFPHCSTTALVAHLKSNGNIAACRTGDSQLLLFKNDNENGISYVDAATAGKSEQGADRLFFRLQLDEKQQFQIVSNQPVYDIVEEKNICNAIAFSDGIGMATELLLKEQFSNNPHQVREEISYQLQATGDDKTICFIERQFTNELTPTTT